MGLPAYIPTRTVGFRGVLELEQGKGLTARVAVRSSGSLRLADTGELFETLGGVFSSGRGASVTFELPVTDDDGWLTTANEIIDVSEGGAYTHTYTAVVTVLDATGQPVGDKYEYGPFVVPASESTLWLDELEEQTTTAGSVVARPTVYAVNGQDGEVTITAAGLGAYVKPNTGVPKTDLAVAVQTSLGKADDALPATEKGADDGVAELVDGKVPAAQTDMAAIAAAPELSAAYVGGGEPTSAGAMGLSPLWKHAYVSPSPADRVPIIEASEVEDGGFVQEPQVFLIGDTIHMYYTSGSAQFHASCSATADPTDPSSWSRSGCVLGGDDDLGGVVGVADHTGVYVEGATVYLYYRDAAGGLSLATAPTSDPTDLTMVGSVLSPPVGVSTPLANPFVIKRGDGDYLFYFEGNTTTPQWSTGLAYGTSPSGPFTGAAMSLTGLQVNPGKSTVSNPYIVAEDGGYTMWFAAAWGEYQRGNASPTAGYMATSQDGEAWELAHGGQQIIRLVHRYEQDQVVDFSLLDVGEEKYAFWSANTEYDQSTRVGRIMATRVRRPLARVVGGKFFPVDGDLQAGPVLPTPYLGSATLSPAQTFTTSATDVLIDELSYIDVELPDRVQVDWDVNLNVISSAAPAYMTVKVVIESDELLVAGQVTHIANPYLTTANQPFPVHLSGKFVQQAGVPFSIKVTVKNGRGDSPTTTITAGATSSVSTRKVP